MSVELNLTITELIAVYDAAMGHCGPGQVRSALVHLGREIDKVEGKIDVFERIAREAHFS